MNIICIIIARGGSKRIPKKNIKSFLGNPIISYSIKNAQDSKIFSDIIVSTDSIEIKAVAEKYGARVPFLRSKKNSDDFSTTSDVVNEVLINYISKYQKPDYVCCLYPTSPLLNYKVLIEAKNLISKHKYKSIVPVTKFNYPIQRSLIIDNNKLKMRCPEHLNSRSQDLKENYHDSGQFYFLETNSFLEKNELFTKNSFPIILPGISVQDIDEEEDWILAELKYKYLKSKNFL